jgi:hypothetical protein
MTNIKQYNLNFIKKEINFLPFEIKEKKNQFEKLKLEVHNKKKLHNEKIEKYKFIINNIKINEKKIEEKNLLIDKIKNKQKLILNAINEGFFNFFKQTIQFSNEKILEGFFMFLKYKKNQIKFINNKEDLFNILSKSYENIFLLENEKFFFELKNKINEIENNFKNKINFPLDLIYEFIKNCLIIVENDFFIKNYENNHLNNEIKEKNCLFGGALNVPLFFDA